eukprot:6172174-Pleurochrysis_carterae.AAC.2
MNLPKTRLHKALSAFICACSYTHEAASGNVAVNLAARVIQFQRLYTEKDSEKHGQVRGGDHSLAARMRPQQASHKLITK